MQFWLPLRWVVMTLNTKRLKALTLEVGADRRYNQDVYLVAMELTHDIDGARPRSKLFGEVEVSGTCLTT
jgi:hypothetical protein